MNPLPLVDHPDRISPDWLSLVLEKNGIDACVKSIRSRPVGLGQMADSYRLSLDYEGNSEGAPETLVVKVPSTDPTSRTTGSSGGYATEVSFYTELAREVAIRTPLCLHADISDNQEAFVLVMEDLAPAVQGDQIRGCEPREAGLALKNLAGLHGSRWCAPELDEIQWLNRWPPPVADYVAQLMKQRTPGFIDRYANRMRGDDADVLSMFTERCAGWLGGRCENLVLVHGDYRLDNLLFGTSEGGAPVATVDWQTLSVGQPGRDVGYFLGNSLEPELRRKHEQALVRVYHDALLAHGVTEYSWETCFDDYRYGQFQGAFITVLGAMSVIQTDRGDDMFMAMCSRSCEAIRDLDCRSLL